MVSFLLGLGLSMDALAVSIVEGALVKKKVLLQAFKMSFAFGLFQALMPLLGAFLAEEFLDWFSVFDHWIAFLVLLVLGLKMFFAKSVSMPEVNGNEVRQKSVLLLAVATSLDALFVGLSLSSLVPNIYLSVLVIGLTTFLLCMVAFLFGDFLKKRFCLCYEQIGGIILIGIGLKVLFEHLVV